MNKLIYIFIISLLLYIEIVPLTYYASKIMFKKILKIIYHTIFINSYNKIFKQFT